MSSMKIVPMPPAVGLVRLPTPMYIFLTFVTFTPASVNVLNGIVHSCHDVARTAFASEFVTSSFLPALFLALASASALVTVASTLQWNLVYNGDAPQEYKARLAQVLTPAPALPPWSGPRVQLSALQPVSEDFGFVPLHRDSAYSGEPIRFRGREYRHGLGMHAQSAVTYAVPPDASAFQSVAGLTDSVNHCRIASAVFEIRGSGGTVVFRSPVLRSTDLPVPVHVDVRGLSEITLAVDDAGDGRDCDHGAWGDAVFLLEPTAPG